MTKHPVWSLLLVAVLLAIPLHAAAQVPVTADQIAVNQYLQDTSRERSPAWWNTLEQQLTLLLQPSNDHLEEALQNVIFFATHHGDKISFEQAAPRLFEIYLHHEQEGYRIMALAALHAIGDDATMRRLLRNVDNDPSDRVRQLTLVALTDRYGAQ